MDTRASANSNATPQTNLDEFHLPIPTPRRKIMNSLRWKYPGNSQPRTLFHDILPSTFPGNSNSSTQGTTQSFCSPEHVDVQCPEIDENPDPIPDNSTSPTSSSTNTSLATPPSLQDVPLDAANDSTEHSQQPQRRQLRSCSIIKSPVRYLGYVLQLNRGAHTIAIS